MTTGVTPSTLAPRAAVVGVVTGLFLMAFFTLMWSANTFAAWPAAVAWPIWAAFAILAVCFIAQGVRLIGLRKRFPAKLSAEDEQYRRSSGRAFGIIFGAEALAIWIVVLILNATGQADYVVPAIALIVGLHFYPMARVFRRTIDLYLATWTTLVGLAGIGALAAGASEDLVIGMVAVGAALATTIYGVYISREAGKLIRGARQAA
ncbi:hypothetical protein [Actinoplanes sp. NPDC048796]|uniref:hypothetical protein n=1 Tax=Actinoplanes sp. NPDC048796 TaxID=3155640 RepID=UPI0033C1B718